MLRTTRSLFSLQIKRRLPTQLLIPPQRQSMKLNKCTLPVEQLYWDFEHWFDRSWSCSICSQYIDSSIHSWWYQCDYSFTAVSLPYLWEQSFWYRSKIRDIGSLRKNPILFIEMKIDWLRFYFLLNACIEKTGPKALQVSRSAKNLLNISSDRDCSFGSKRGDFQLSRGRKAYSDFDLTSFIMEGKKELTSRDRPICFVIR